MLVSDEQMQTAVGILSKLIDGNTLGNIEINHYDNETEKHIFIDRTEYELVLLPFVTKTTKDDIYTVLIPDELIARAEEIYLSNETIFIPLDQNGTPVCIIPFSREFISEYYNFGYAIRSASGFKKEGKKVRMKCAFVPLMGKEVRRVNELVKMTMDNVRCPECGGHMVVRTAKRGYAKGNQFWGCDNFPNCRHTEHMRLPDLTEQTGISVSNVQDVSADEQDETSSDGMLL